MLANEYGWSLDYILYNIYPEDFFYLVRQIKERQVSEYLNTYMIHASVASEDKSFIERLIEEQKSYIGVDPNPQLDRVALETWKKEMAEESNTIKTKVK